MNKPAHFFLRALWGGMMALSLMAMATISHAQTFKLDDSTSPRSRIVPRSVVDESGRPLNKSEEPSHAILRFGEVVYRLDMRPHLGQEARIYFVRALEPGPSNGSRINWVSRNGVHRGSLMSGERNLVWSGRVSEPWMIWELQLELNLDLQRLTRSSAASGANPSTFFELEK